jgi:hypothetical protein
MYMIAPLQRRTAMHGPEIFALLAVCVAAVGVHGYFHSRQFWEGLPPVLDAFVSMASFAAVIAAFVFAGQIGGKLGHPHAARLLAVTVVIVTARSIRTWIGLEQIRYRAARAKVRE